jgi:hypothetical protein
LGTSASSTRSTKGFKGACDHKNKQIAALQKQVDELTEKNRINVHEVERLTFVCEENGINPIQGIEDPPWYVRKTMRGKR